MCATATVHTRLEYNLNLCTHARRMMHSVRRIPSTRIYATRRSITSLPIPPFARKTIPSAPKQLITVIVPTAPQLLDVPQSEVLVSGRSVRRNCTTTTTTGGQQTAHVTWYRDGHLVRNGSVMRVDGATTELVIRSFDLVHQGTYQCVATNAAGDEVHATFALQLSKMSETSLRPPRNVTCYPYNATAYLVGFESVTRIDGLVVHQVNERPGESWVSASSARDAEPQMLHGRYVFGSWWQPFELFGLIVRGMQTHGFQMASGGRKTDMFELSPLSGEVKCALQGCE